MLHTRRPQRVRRKNIAADEGIACGFPAHPPGRRFWAAAIYANFPPIGEVLMQQQWMIAAAIAAMCGPAMAAAAAAAPVPATVTAAVSDKSRPPEDTARDADRKPAEMLVFAGIK